MNPLISIIIPIYNIDRYLKECINSVLNQTYSNLEIILVNDGSRDGCELICKEYLKLDKRIKYFKKRNGGLSSSRNYGIKKSHGDYICFIDGDDYVKPNFIELLYKNLHDLKCDLAICGYLQFKCDNANETCMMFASDVRKSPRILTPEEIWNEFYFKRNFSDYGIVICCNKLFKKQLFEKYKFKKILHEDEYASHNLFHLCKRICIIDDCLYCYRTNREGSLTYKSFRDKKNRPRILAHCSFDRMCFFIKYNYSLKLIECTKNDWLKNYNNMPIKDRRINKYKIIYVTSQLEKFNLISSETKDAIYKFQSPFIWFLLDLNKKLKKFFLKPFYFIKKFKRKEIYVCDTYFHVLCSCAKAIKSKRKCDIAITNNIVGYKELKERLISSKLFENVYDFDNKSSIEIKRSQKLNYYFHGLKQIKVFKKLLPFSLFCYKKIFIYNDWTQFSMYLKDLRRKYYLIEDGINFYETFKGFKGYPYFNKTFKMKLFDLIFPFNINHYNYHDKCRCVKSIEVDHINNNELDSYKKIKILSKKQLFNCFNEPEKMELLMDIFDINDLAKLNNNKKNVIIFGNCQYVDKLYTYQDEYNIYKKISDFYLKRGFVVLFKGHPRDYTKYEFKDVINLNSLFPSEIILFTNLENKITFYIGIETSSVLMFPPEKVRYFPLLSDFSIDKL